MMSTLPYGSLNNWKDCGKGGGEKIVSDPCCSCDRTMNYIVERVTLVFYVHVSPNGQYVRLGRNDCSDLFAEKN